MPTYEVKLRDKTSGTTLTTKKVAASSRDIDVDLARYEIVSVVMKAESVTLGPFDGSKATVTTGAFATPHTAAANGASTSDAAIINLLASLDQRQDRWFRRRTGVVSIMLGVFLGLSLFALTAVIIALALGRPL